MITYSLLAITSGISIGALYFLFGLIDIFTCGRTKQRWWHAFMPWLSGAGIIGGVIGLLIGIGEKVAQL